MSRSSVSLKSRSDLAQALLRELAYVLDDDCATRRYKNWYNARPRSSGMSKNGYLYLPAAARFLAAGSGPESATRCGVGEEMLMEEAPLRGAATRAKRGRPSKSRQVEAYDEVKSGGRSTWGPDPT